MGGNILKLDREILIEESEARGEARGEERMVTLINTIIKLGASEAELQKVLTDKEYRKEMYQKYNIQ